MTTPPMSCRRRKSTATRQAPSASAHPARSPRSPTTRCAYQSSSTRIVKETYPAVSGRAAGYAHCPAGYLPISGGAQIVSDDNVADITETREYSTPVRNGEIGWYAAGSTYGTNGG
jgi:hypothetical protein